MIPDNHTPGMHPADIQASLRKLGISQKSIAIELSVSETMVTQVIKNINRSRRIADWIAKKLDKKADDIWPGSYQEEDSI